MGWSFRRRIKVIPGVYLNVSKRGVSASVGVRGASLTLRGDGTYANAGIPGTGLYKRQKISGASSRSLSNNSSSSPQPQSFDEFNPDSIDKSADYQFVSADPLEIVSPGLKGLQTAVIEANRQKHQLENDLTLIHGSIGRTRFLIALSKVFLLYFGIPALRRNLLNLLGDKQRAVAEVKSSIRSSSVPLDIQMDVDVKHAYDALFKCFEKLMSSQYIWDITSASDVDNVKLRSVASSAISRTRTRFSFAHVQGIKSESPAFHLMNANGADIYIYPGFFVMHQNPERLGIVELTNLFVSFERTGFVETDAIPRDSRQLSEVWERSNKDGSRDKRFADNRKLPVMEYGEITFSTSSGVYEKFMVSDCESAMTFVESLRELIGLI